VVAGDFSLLSAAAVGNNGTQGKVEGVQRVADNRQGLCNWPTWLAAAWFAAATAGVAGGQGPAWKTGPALRKQLDTPLSLTWGDREARDALTNLSQTTAVAIFLDRRLDPDHKLDFSASEEPLQAVLAVVAQRLDGDVSLVGSVVYIGPRPTAGKLATLAALKRQEAQQLAGDARARLQRSEVWRWEEPSEPRLLLAELAKRGGVKVENSELIPHDLWTAVSWPAMPWTDRMTLLLAGFGLTYELASQGTAIRLIPVPEELILERSYSPRGAAAEAAASLRRSVPEARIKVAGQRLLVSASAEDHDKIDRLLRGETVKSTKVGPAVKRYTLELKDTPAGAIMQSIASTVGKELKYDPSLIDKLKTRVAVSVKEVPLEELLDKTLRPLGLSCSVTETALVVQSK
jgi:hypothetical protein